MTAAQPLPSTRRLPGLEALRLIAAVCVLLLHALANFGGTRLWGKGYLGVDFFLMLSGFLMVRAQEEKLAAGASPWRFMARRYWRLWPTMAAGGLLGLPRLFIRARSLADALWVGAANLALLPVPWHRFVFPLNVPAWTIFAELTCNLLHVTLLWRLRRGWIWVAVLALLPLEVAMGVHWGHYNLGAQPTTFPAGLARCLFAYALGIGLSRLWRQHWVPPVPWWLALPLMPALLAGSVWMKIGGWQYELGFILLVCPLMIAGALRLKRFHGAAGWMGRIAFPLFALQMPVLEGMRMLHGTYAQAVGLACLAGVLGALASHGLARLKSRHITLM